MKTAYGAASFSCWALLLMALMSSMTGSAYGADVAARNKDYSYMDSSSVVERNLYYTDSSSVVERNLAPLVTSVFEFNEYYIRPYNETRSNINTQTFSAAEISSYQSFDSEPWYSEIPVTAVQIFYTLPGQTKAKKANLKKGADGVWSILIKKLPVGPMSWYFVATNSLKQTVKSQTYTLTIVPAPPAGAGINCENPIVFDLYDAVGGSTDDRYTYLFSLKNALSTCKFGCDCADFSAPGQWSRGFWFKVNNPSDFHNFYFDIYVQVTSGPGVASITRFQGDTCDSLSLCESATEPETDCNGYDIFTLPDYSPGPPHTCLNFPDGPSGWDENHYFFVQAHGADSTTKLTVIANLNF